MVLLHRVEDASPAERVAEAVDVATTSSRILEGSFSHLGEDLRLAGCHLGPCVHLLDERGEPVGRHLHVGVEQDIVGAVHLHQRFVVSFGKAVVAVQLDDSHFGEVGPHPLHRIVGGSIVGHNDFGLILGIFHDLAQVVGQHLLTVPVEYYDGYLHHVFG